MKIFKNKKAFGFTISIALLLISAAIGAGAMVGVSYWTNRDPDPEPVCVGDECFEPPENQDPVEKECRKEMGCGESDFGDTVVNHPRTFERTCGYLNDLWGSKVYFKEEGVCTSCHEKYKEQKLPSSIDMKMYTTLELCKEDTGDSVECIEIESKADCAKAKTAECVNPVQLEEHCSEPDPPPEECPDVMIASVLPFPDLYCQLKLKLKELFLPFQIISTIIVGIATWLSVLFTLNAVELGMKKKTEKRVKLIISIIIGIVAGALIYFYWFYGLLLFIIALIAKLFIWRR